MNPSPSGAAGRTGQVVEAKCIGCGTCVLACAYGALRLRKTKNGRKASVDLSLCQGDGLCSSLCATGAVILRDSPDEEIVRQIDAAFAARDTAPTP